jgi:hypothetical protein
MSQKSVAGQALAFLSSLRLAVVTMVTLGSVCGFATFYEMRNGTPAVQRDIYQTPWFAFLLALLGTNVVSVMASRYPWTKHHVGFLTAHVGILTILLGYLLVLMAWYGVNFVLGTGLHSYGFGSGGYWYVGGFVAFELLVITAAPVRCGAQEGVGWHLLPYSGGIPLAPGSRFAIRRGSPQTPLGCCFRGGVA